MIKILFCLLPPCWLKLPPLSLAYLSAILKKNNYSDDIFIDYNSLLYARLKKRCPAADIVLNWEKNNNGFNQSFFEKLIEHEPEFICGIINTIKQNNITHIAFSVFKSNYCTTDKISEIIRNYFPEIKIIAGGPEITQLAALKKKISINADIIIAGEGELPVLSIKNKSSNALYLFAEEKNIDDIPFPDFSIFSFENYKTRKCLPLLMSRGCINSCVFCSEKNLYKNFKFRQHSFEYMLEQINLLNKNFGVSWFIFQDSMINARLDELEKLCCGLIKKLPAAKWEAQIYIRDDMPESLFKLMKKAGCYNLFVGLESGSDAMLNKMNKKFNSAEARRFFEKCRNAGLHFEISLIIGHPGETSVTIEETKKFLRENSALIPKIAQINPYVYYEHSEISSEEKEWSDNNRQLLQNEIKNILDIAENYNIRFTKSFINNLQGAV